MTLSPVTRKSSRSRHSSDFIHSVIELKPRVVAFDCDGTLWVGDAGEGFFTWELNRRLVSDAIVSWGGPRYAEYRAGMVSEDEMCGEMVIMHVGLSETYVQKAANQYFEENFVRQIFPEMRALVQKLEADGCEIWAVSSTNEWVIRAAMGHFGIPQDKILAAAAEVENGIIAERLIRVPSGHGKAEAIRSAIKKPLDAAFGNSKWDIAMLEIAGKAYAVNPTPELETVARERGWRIYFPDPIEA